MTSPVRALTTPEGGRPDLDAVVEALAAEFDVSTWPREPVHRSRLDTFDRRLRAAGMALDHQRSGSEEQLVLTTAGGTPVVARVDDLRLPAMAATLPAGHLRDAVAPVAGIRALTVVRDERRQVRRLELHNEDDKIVARVELDEPAGRTSGSPSELVVRALRGYSDEARRATRLLVRLGLRPVADDDVASGSGSGALADRSLPAVQLLATELGEFLATMQANLPGLLDDVDTEFLHDFRVAVRRTRSTLKLGRPALPDTWRTRWEPEFKWVGDLTTPLRDLDVYELDLPTMTGWLVAAEPAHLRPFGSYLRRRRTAARRTLVRALRSARFQHLLVDWQHDLDDLPALPAARGEPPISAGELADRDISRIYRRVVRDAAAITADSPPEDLHSLRKRCKELRYALEAFAPVVDRAARKRAVADLKGLQDVLGRFQDSEVQRRALRGFAEEMMADGTSAESVLAMGELVAHLDAEQDRARRDFDSAFARFTRPSSERRMRALGGRR